MLRLMLQAASPLDKAAKIAPPHVWFGVSAIFHYLGPSFAVLLFPSVGVLGVAWLRIASAALIFAPWTTPWRFLRGSSRRELRLLIALGFCLAAMNTAFYLALERLPLGLVAAIEFAGTIGVAAYGLRTKRNVAALLLTLVGVLILIDVRWSSDPLGLFWAFLNGGLFVGYILLGHRIARSGAADGIKRLGAAMAIAFLFVLPVGFGDVLHALADPLLIFAGVGVGLCSSVIPYVCDQIAMSRLPRASFALLLALLPATATIIGIAVLNQIPSATDVLGVACVMIGVAFHKPPASKDASGVHEPAVRLDPETMSDQMKRDLGLAGGRAIPPRNPLSDRVIFKPVLAAASRRSASCRPI